MSKYHGLPDIDTAPDIFETSDEPDGLLRPSEGGLEDDAPTKPIVHSENIDSSGLPGRRKAERVFGRGSRRHDPKSSTFGARLPPLTSRSYASSSSSSDEESPIPKETPAQRVRRLKAELADVEHEINGAGPYQPRFGSGAEGNVEGGKKRKSVLPPKEPVDLLGELAGLRERLSGMEVDELDEGGAGVRSGVWEDRLSRLGRSSQEGNGSGKGGEDADGEDDEKGGVRSGGGGIGDLDRRLAMLEDLIGPSDLVPDQPTSPLLPTLSKLDHLLTLLTQPRHLDSISRRIKLLLVDLDRAATASRRSGPTTIANQPPDKPSNLTLSAGEYQSLQSLFSILPRLDPLLPILGPLLNRLRSLSGLHAEANEVAEGLRRLTSDEKRYGEEVEEMRGVVDGIQKGLGEAGGGGEEKLGGVGRQDEGDRGEVEGFGAVMEVSEGRGR